MTAAERAKALALLRKLRATQDLVDLLGGEIALLAEELRSKVGTCARRHFASDLDELSMICYGGDVIACIEACEKQLAS